MSKELFSLLFLGFCLLSSTIIIVESVSVSLCPAVSIIAAPLWRTLSVNCCFSITEDYSFFWNISGDIIRFSDGDRGIYIDTDNTLDGKSKLSIFLHVNNTSFDIQCQICPNECRRLSPPQVFTVSDLVHIFAFGK